MSRSGVGLPEGFSYLSANAPQDEGQHYAQPVEALRYSGCENMTGRPLAGYKSNKVIATDECNKRLHRINKKLQDNFGLCLVVYDSYRPRKAVKDLWNWANMPPLSISSSVDASSQQYDPDRMAAKYFPKFSGGGCGSHTRTTLFEKGYISLRSNHSRGSTVDVTLVELSKRDIVRIGDKAIGVQNRHGILRMTDAPICDNQAKTSSSSSSSRRNSFAGESMQAVVAHAENTSTAAEAAPSSGGGIVSCAPALTEVCASIVERGQQVFIPDFKPFDERVREFINPKLTEAQKRYIASTENEILMGGINIVSRSSKGESDTAAIRALDRYGSLPFVDDETVDMGTSFDLFDLASHPIWPGHFAPLKKKREEDLDVRDVVGGEAGEGEDASGFPKETQSSAELLKVTLNGSKRPLPEAVVAHPTFLYRRLLLQCLFEEEGFEISDEEWWHFALRDEPFPPKDDEPEYGFDFDVE